MSRRIVVMIYSASDNRDMEMFDAIAELVHGERFEGDVIADVAMELATKEPRND